MLRSKPVRQALGRGVCLVAAVTVLHTALGAAQTLTGSLSGTVRDEQGGVLVGAVVTVSSPVLIGGPVPSSTDAKGVFRFPGLPPGSYVLDVTMPNFAPRPVTGIVINMGNTLDIGAVVLKPSVSVAIDVAPPRVDTQDPGYATRYDAGDLSEIPTRRNGPSAFIATAPGVSPTSQATSFVSMAGSGVDQNLSLVDGTNVTATSNGITRSETGIDFIQQIQVQPVGASAEYGNAQGGIINILTRQGSNLFQWDGSLYGQFNTLTSQPIRRPINESGPEESGYERRYYLDATTTLGGPIAKDRVWLFAGYQHLRDEDSQPGGDPGHPKRYLQDKLFGKLTWRLAPGWQLVQTYHQEFWDNRELPTATKTVEATQRLHASVPAITFGHLTHTASPNSMWDVRLGRFTYSQDIDRVAGNPEDPSWRDVPTNRITGAPQSLGEIKQVRWTAKATYSYYRTDLGGTDHEWKFGGEFSRGTHRSLMVIPTGVRYEVNGAATQAIRGNPSNAGGLAVATSAFVSDAIRLGGPVTVTAGLRFDHSRGISPDVARLDADGADTGEIIAGEGALYRWNVFSPRVGIVIKLTPDGRTVLRASYGRFSQGILTGELSQDHPGVAATTAWNFDPVTGDETNPVRTDPRINVQVDPGTRAPLTDAYTIGVDRAIAGSWTATAMFAHKDGQQFIGWQDIGGTYREETRVVDGTTIPVFVLSSQPPSRLYNLTNQSNYSFTYEGVVLALEKRRSRGWQVDASYTWSRAMGLQPSSGTTAAGAQVGTTGAPPVFFAPPVTFGRDPNTLTNAEGRLPNDRPHLFRLTSAIDVPKAGILVAANLQHASGKPWARTVDLTLSQAQRNVRVLLEPRGTHRLSSQTVLDLRFSKAFPLADAGTIELRLDLLNALNDTAEESIASDVYNASNFGDGNVFLDPRRAMVSVKLSFGQ